MITEFYNEFSLNKAGYRRVSVDNIGGPKGLLDLKWFFADNGQDFFILPEKISDSCTFFKNSKVYIQLKVGEEYPVICEVPQNIRKKILSTYQKRNLEGIK